MCVFDKSNKFKITCCWLTQSSSSDMNNDRDCMGISVLFDFSADNVLGIILYPLDVLNQVVFTKNKSVYGLEFFLTQKWASIVFKKTQTNNQRNVTFMYRFKFIPLFNHRCIFFNLKIFYWFRSNSYYFSSINCNFLIIFWIWCGICRSCFSSFIINLNSWV